MKQNALIPLEILLFLALPLTLVFNLSQFGLEQSIGKTLEKAPYKTFETWSGANKISLYPSIRQIPDTLFTANKAEVDSTKPIVFFLPSLGLPVELIPEEYYNPLLQQKYQVILLDYQNLFPAGETEDPHTYLKIAQKILTMLQTVEVQKRGIHLIGGSLGGLIALTITQLDSDNLIKSLCLISPILVPSKLKLDTGRLQSTLAREQAKLDLYSSKLRKDKFIYTYLSYVYNLSLEEENEYFDLAENILYWEASSPKLLSFYLNTQLKALTRDLGTSKKFRIKVPTYLVASRDNDHIISDSTARLFKRLQETDSQQQTEKNTASLINTLFENLEIRWIEKEGHFLFPKEVIGEKIMAEGMSNFYQQLP